MKISTTLATAVLGLCLFVAPCFAAAWTAQEDAGLAATLAAAEPLKTEDLGVPVTATQKGELMFVPNLDSKSYDLLQWYWPHYSGPTEAIIMDLARGEMKKARIPDGLQIHICGRALAPNGKFYFATPNWRLGMLVFVYDPETETIRNLGEDVTEEGGRPGPDGKPRVWRIAVPGLSGEKRDLTVGPDGMIYGTGSYGKEGKAGAYQIDPNTDKITIYGPVGPSHKPSGVWGYSVAADDRHVYVASGKVPWYLVAYDRQTGKDATLLSTETVQGFVGVGQERHGASGIATRVKMPDGSVTPRLEFWLYQGQVVLKKAPNEAPPWPQPAQVKPWVALPPKPEVWLGKAVPGSDGEAEIWCRTPEAKAAAANPPLEASPEQLGWRKVAFNVPTYPMGIYRLTELPDGRIFGSAGEYEGNFMFDPKTGKSEHLGKIHLSHYATAILDGLVYMSGYPSSPLYVYDPAQPWTANAPLGGAAAGGLPALINERDKRSNPRQLLLMGEKNLAGTHKMYAAATGADGKVYFGGQWVRDGSGGGLAWYDPKTGQAEGMWDVFSNYQINFMTAAADGKHIVISAMRVRDATLGKPTPEQGKLFIFDTAQGKIVREVEPVMKAKGPGLVADAGQGRVIGWSVDPDDEEKSSILYGVDAAGEVAWRKKLPWKLPVPIGSNQKEAFDFRRGPDGAVWTFMGGALVRILPEDGRIAPAGKLRGSRLAFSGNDVYVYAGASLQRVKGLLAGGK